MLSGKLEKAVVVVYKKSGDSMKVDKKYPVQFNPSEYSIAHSTQLSQMRGLAKDTDPKLLQTVYGENATLSVTLYFDSYNELKASQNIVNSGNMELTKLITGGYTSLKNKKYPSWDMNQESTPKADVKVNKLFEDIIGLLKYKPEEHEPPMIGFIWGRHLNFAGKLVSSSADYTMFDRDGTPVRAKVSLSIVGEEVEYVQNRSEYPNESPDRTKHRMLRYGDSIFTLANEEYGDPAYWKIIAKANNILNPRMMEQVLRLKLPSIR